MASRITDKDLAAVVARINRTTGSPSEPYIRGETGSYVAQVGNYHISHAYGGVSLHRMVGTGGGVSDVFSRGHVPKRDLYECMHAFLRGFDAGKGE
jgi:hypothetical protein